MNKLKMFLTSIVVAFTGNAMAQELSAEKVDIAPSGTADLVITLGGTDTELTAAQFSLTLPEGIDIAEEDYAYLTSTQSGYEVKVEEREDSYLILVVRKSSKSPALTLGTIATITLQATDAPEGVVKAKVSGINFSKKGVAVSGNEDFTVDINVDSTTGISAITAEQLKAGNVYDLNGKKVSSVKKGVYVVNGKKVIVK